MDVGCGEGVLLQHLTHAPPWRAYTPETPAPSVSERPDFIHVRELHGLDILHGDLLYAAEITAPARHTYGWTRFEQLDVSIWEGGLQVPNPLFKGIECIIATEVYGPTHPKRSHWLIDLKNRASARRHHERFRPSPTGELRPASPPTHHPLLRFQRALQPTGGEGENRGIQRSHRPHRASISPRGSQIRVDRGGMSQVV